MAAAVLEIAMGSGTSSQLRSWAAGCPFGQPRAVAAARRGGGGVLQLREPRGAGAIVLSRRAPTAVSRGAH